ncbi:MAG: hypothetical protein R3A13_07510 [Bdellovibrionota bacterium]
MPELNLPKLEPMNVTPSIPDIPKVPDTVNQPQMSVKTPEGIKAYRIRIGDDLLHELPIAGERMSSVKAVDKAVRLSMESIQCWHLQLQRKSQVLIHYRSRDGHASKGLFQLLDSTGAELHEGSGVIAEYNPFDSDQKRKARGTIFT